MKNKNFLDNPEVWARAGQWIVILAMIYYGWGYIIGFLALCGAYFLWKEWKKGNRR